jgi:hypothetical protein
LSYPDPGGLNDAGPNAKTTYSSSAGVGAVRTVAYDTGALPGAVKPSASPCALQEDQIRPAVQWYEVGPTRPGRHFGCAKSLELTELCDPTRAI